MYLPIHFLKRITELDLHRLNLNYSWLRPFHVSLRIGHLYLCVISGLLRNRCQDRIIRVRDLLREEAGKGKEILDKGIQTCNQ